jgi:Cu(I)/Ag(I) efflux system periplasmic protein CusF
MKTSSLICSIALTLFASGSFAQATAPSTPSTSATVAPMVKDMADAEVRKVDRDAKKVTLKHGPIKNLDMPSMTMVFQVRDEKLFDKLVAGEKIKFTAEQLQGAFVVTGVEKAEAK